ncbi:uncharacterized protein PAC_19894 [Phialocephala subalpina]|uniref:Uncharacterized protein n=1 Tax=Phialocephala subalpina TaxID=576137 RepID=A0A1L7XY43_9HELO|nr:uncharacterized protein PAC_19894 [Phialocephala subalpina]
MSASAITSRALSQGRIALRGQPGSTTAYFQSRRLQSSQNKSPNDNKNNKSLPSASFKDLGASRTVKIVVFSFLAVAGTLETITWSKLLWAKFGPAKSEGDSASKN